MTIQARERTSTVNGVDLRVTEAGEGPAVILAHGFPELAYSWRHQVPALAEAGYHVLAPDQRGYGGSSRPSAVEEYDVVNLAADLIGLLDETGQERGVFVGHDWGSLVVWQLALLHPDRVAGVVGMSVPFSRRTPVPPTKLFAQLFGDSFFYILYFQEPGPADAELAEDPGRTMRLMLSALSGNGDDAPALTGLAGEAGGGLLDRLGAPTALPAWLGQEQLDHYSSEFARTGFTGGINWYRNFDRNWELTAHLDGAHVTAPSLFITGRLDPVALMSPASGMDGWLDDHRGTVVVDGAGHWVQQEAPEAVNAALLEFLAGLDLGTGKE